MSLLAHDRSAGRIMGSGDSRGSTLNPFALGVVSPRPGATLFACLLACACEVTGLPGGAHRFAAPAQYRAWWALTEACSGLRGDFSAVTWYVVPNADSFSLEGETVNGAWSSDGNRIVLGASVTTDGSLVRHEMLHALLQSGKHPRKQFLADCGDIVVCIEQCVTDAGGPPDTSQDAPILPPSALPAAVLLAPDTVPIATDSGWITITVTLTNTSNQPARAETTTHQGTPFGEVRWSSSPILLGFPNELLTSYYFTLAPAGTAGSTRRVVFDQQLPLENTLSQFAFTGKFQESLAPAKILTVAP